MKKILLVLFLFFSSCSLSQEFEGPYIVHAVIDGDTLDIDIGRIRLSGINTPETGECYYEEAKEKLEELSLYQEVFIEEGYARVYDKYNETTKYYSALKELETIAKEKKVGIWSCTSLKENCLYVASKNSKIYHKPDCKWAKRIKAENLICFHSEEELEGYEADRKS